MEGMVSSRSIPMSINWEAIVAEGAVFGDLIVGGKPVEQSLLNWTGNREIGQSPVILGALI